MAIFGQSQGSDGPVEVIGRRTQFTPPAAATPGNIPHLPRTGFYSDNFHPFAQHMRRMAAFPAYRPPLPPGTGPQQMSPISPPAPAGSIATTSPMPSSPAPGATHGLFGAAGFGSAGGTRQHFHVDPYMVMRQGVIPGVSPSGRNIRAGYENAGARVHNSMPFQSMQMAPDAPPPPAPAPAATHGFGRSPFWSHARHARHAAVQTVAAAPCEWVGPRLDGTMVQICNGHVVAYRDGNGNMIHPDDFQGAQHYGWFRRNFGWRRH